MWQRSKCSSSKNWNSRTQRSRNNRKLFRAMTLRKKMKHQQKNHRNKCRTVSNLSQGSVRGLSPFTAASSNHTSFLTDQLGPKEAQLMRASQRKRNGELELSLNPPLNPPPKSVQRAQHPWNLLVSSKKKSQTRTVPWMENMTKLYLKTKIVPKNLLGSIKAQLEMVSRWKRDEVKEVSLNRLLHPTPESVRKIQLLWNL